MISLCCKWLQRVAHKWRHSQDFDRYDGIEPQLWLCNHNKGFSTRENDSLDDLEQTQETGQIE